MIPADAASTDPVIKVTMITVSISIPRRDAIFLSWAVARIAFPSRLFFIKACRAIISITDDIMIKHWRYVRVEFPIVMLPAGKIWGNILSAEP